MEYINLNIKWQKENRVKWKFAVKKKILKFAMNEQEICSKSAAIAQSVEHFIRNEKVMGSSPIRGSGKEGVSYSESDTFSFFLREATLSKNWTNNK